MTMPSHITRSMPSLPLPMEKFAWIQEQLVKAGKLAKPLDLKSRDRAAISRKGAGAGRRALIRHAPRRKGPDG